MFLNLFGLILYYKIWCIYFIYIYVNYLVLYYIIKFENIIYIILFSFLVVNIVYVMYMV